jgi:hypothetical protein
MPLTKHEKQEIVDEVYKKLQPELENFKNNVSTQIKSIYSELINNSVDAKTNYSKLDKKLDNLLFTLVGNDLDNENSLFARFKRVESFLNIIKEKKAFIIGSLAGITTIVGIVIGALYFIMQIVNFLKNTK